MVPLIVWTKLDDSKKPVTKKHDYEKSYLPSQILSKLFCHLVVNRFKYQLIYNRNASQNKQLT